MMHGAYNVKLFLEIYHFQSHLLRNSLQQGGNTFSHDVGPEDTHFYQSTEISFSYCI